MDNKKGNIGIFDSGLGGLWILKHLKEKLSNYNYIFYADQANIPYGHKTKDELFEITAKALDFLYGEKNCMGVILACNTVSSNIYERLRNWKDKKYFGRILFGIVHPTVESLNPNEKTVIFATPRTCESEIYDKFFKEHIKDYLKIPMKDLACKIENDEDVFPYINSFKEQVPNNTVRGALLCTHYGIVKNDFKKVFPDIKTWIYQEEIVPNYINNYFKEFPERENFFKHGNEIFIYMTKDNIIFKDFAQKWFGDKVKIQVIKSQK